MAKAIKSSTMASYISKAGNLHKFIANDPYLAEKIKTKSTETVFKDVTVFLSVCDKKSRAVVFNATAQRLAEAYSKASEKVLKYIEKTDMKVLWLKADIIIGCEVVKYADLKNTLSDTREYFFSKGISFDTNFNTALLPEQLNTEKFINYKKKILSLPTLRKYFTDNNIPEFSKICDSVIVFSTSGYISDENKKLYKLYTDDENHGRRIVPQVDKPLLEGFIDTSAEYLSKCVTDSGRFIYGAYPPEDHYFTSYNILRHTGTIWTLLMQYSINHNPELIPKINKTINYLMEFVVWQDEDTCYLIEKKSNEIKLGGNGVTIIALSLYYEVFHDSKYNDFLAKMANGILKMQNSDGSYVHVLEPDTFAVKEKYRIVYYDGEATFALSKIYTMTGNRKYLDAAKKSIDYMIEKKYEKYRDHWVSYAVNEITKHIPDEKYFNFGLKNANVNLQTIYNQDTTYHTYLELLMSTFELYDRINRNNLTASYLSEFDAPFFFKTIIKRVHHQLNGYLYPEIAMYFKCPEHFVYTFCVRHDNFRVRIDDVQHFIGGYYSFYNNYDKIYQYISKSDEKEKDNGLLELIRTFGSEKLIKEISQDE